MFGLLKRFTTKGESRTWLAQYCRRGITLCEQRMFRKEQADYQRGRRDALLDVLGYIERGLK